MPKGLRTTVVGSWWPLAECEEDLRLHHAGQLTAEQGRAALNRATATAISEQRALGLTEWTGGEYFTQDFIEHLQRVLTGIRIEVPTKAEIFDYDDIAVARIEGELGAPNGLGYARAYERERAIAGGVSKATVAGPVEAAINVMGQFDALRPQLPNLIRAVNKEIRQMAAAGCPHVQLDVPTCSTLITNGVMTVDETAAMIAACFEGVRGCRRGIHICSGNLRGRPLAGNLTCAPWADILVRLDGVIDVAHLALQYFNRYLERGIFSQIPRSIELAAGILDEGSYWVEPVSKIRERAAAWAQVVGEERLWLAPSCGFGRHPVRDIPVLRQKVENLVEAAAAFG